MHARTIGSEDPEDPDIPDHRAFVIPIGEARPSIGIAYRLRVADTDGSESRRCIRALRAADARPVFTVAKLLALIIDEASTLGNHRGRDSKCITAETDTPKTKIASIIRFMFDSSNWKRGSL